MEHDLSCGFVGNGPVRPSVSNAASTPLILSAASLFRRRRLIIISQIYVALNSLLRQISLLFYSITKLLINSAHISCIRSVLLYPAIQNNGLQIYATFHQKGPVFVLSSASHSAEP